MRSTAMLWEEIMTSLKKFLGTTAVAAIAVSFAAEAMAV